MRGRRGSQVIAPNEVDVQVSAELSAVAIFAITSALALPPRAGV